LFISAVFVDAAYIKAKLASSHNRRHNFLPSAPWLRRCLNRLDKPLYFQ
jgi:hypothetical protein